MPNYRRYRVPGGTFAFTVCLADRSSRALIENIGVVRRAYAETCANRPFDTRAICVLPNHLHAIWSLPEGDTDYPARWRGFKLRVTHALGRRIWQDRYWEQFVRDDDALSAAIDYVHENPVKHGLVRDIADWPYSSWQPLERNA